MRLYADTRTVGLPGTAAAQRHFAADDLDGPFFKLVAMWEQILTQSFVQCTDGLRSKCGHEPAACTCMRLLC